MRSIEASGFTRRTFLQATAGVSAAALVSGGARFAFANPSKSAVPETLVSLLYESLTPQQKNEVCFDWDYKDSKLGLLRTRVAANWNITDPEVHGDYFTAEQQATIRQIFEGMIEPEWHAKFDKQLEDDAGGFGRTQSIAIFGKPGTDTFEFVLTGRHMTLRCDGNSAEHVAFGGPMFYGHAASGFTEDPDHPGNVFWHQAIEANKVFGMLDGKQRQQALAAKSPQENRVGFQGPNGAFSGIPVSELSSDQKEQVQATLRSLIEPYRQSDRNEVLACLKSQGGLDKCHLTFYKSPNLGDDEMWDNWRLEGPAFVWHFRGAPHVHVWVNVASTPSVALNA